MKVIQSFDYSFRNYFGYYISNETSTVGYVPIAKNASSFMRKFVKENFNWTKQYDYKFEPKAKYITVLRDPYERWFAGVAEYFTREHKNLNIDNKSILQFICQRVVLDTHTEPQVNFLQSLHVHNIVFFKFDEKLSTNLQSYFKQENLNDNIIDVGMVNTSFGHAEKQHIHKLLKNYLQTNPKYIASIKKIYEYDYNLINSVKFYEAS